MEPLGPSAAEAIASEVIDEGRRAYFKHGEPSDRSGLEWLAILAEEFGEAATEVTQAEVPPIADAPGYHARLRAELVQVASVASRWIGAIDRGEGTGYTPQPAAHMGHIEKGAQGPPR